MLSLAAPVGADTTEARCDIYPKGDDHASATLACDFSQRQGYVSIQRADGVRYELQPSDDVAGNYTDQDGRPAYRRSGLGNKGLIFRLADESVFVYWDASTLPSATPDPDSPTAPYTTADYDATALLPCSFEGPSHDLSCPAGIKRGDAGAASIRIMKPDGVERVLNITDTDVSSPGGGDLSWKRVDGDWDIRIDGKEFFTVPEAAVYGG
jgi:hypothetical protein